MHARRELKQTVLLIQKPDPMINPNTSWCTPQMTMIDYFNSKTQNKNYSDHKCQIDNKIKHYILFHFYFSSVNQIENRKIA
jgi:hypothetical protein